MIVKDENYIATFTNTKPEPGTGSLEISKEIAGAVTDADRKTQFTFTVTLQDKDGNALSGSFPYSGSNSKEGTISNGETITLAGGEKIVIRDLPLGTQYTVTETVPEGWEATSDTVSYTHLTLPTNREV